MIYLADTHSLIWFLTEDENLSNEARGVFLKAEKGEVIIVIPTIVLAEMLFICEKKGFKNEFSQFIEKIKNSQNFVFYNLDLDVIMVCEGLANIREMHDRIIVATAIGLGAMVITKDEEIKITNYIKTIW